ncbi:hypothetical protein S83_042479, partial [Arachis hypogaea]
FVRHPPTSPLCSQPGATLLAPVLSSSLVSAVRCTDPHLVHCSVLYVVASCPFERSHRLPSAASPPQPS